MKIDVFHRDRRQNLTESDKGSWFNQLFESEAASASSLDVSVVSTKKKHNGKQKKAMKRESYLKKTSPDYSSSFDSSLYETSASLKSHCGTFSSVCFCNGSMLPSFCFVLCWPRLKGVRPWTRAAALGPWYVFVLAKDVAFVSFCP